MADRIIFQNNKTKLEDKTVLWQLKERGNDTNMDCVNSVSVILPVKGEIKKFTSVIYELYFRLILSKYGLINTFK